MRQNSRRSVALAIALLTLPIAVGAQEEARQAGDALIPKCGFARSLCGYVDRDGKTIIEPIFDWADRFFDGRALVRRAGKYGFIDESGMVVLPIAHELAGRFKRGRAPVLVQGKVGIINSSGQWVIPPEFRQVLPLADDRFLVDTASNALSVPVDPPKLAEPQYTAGFNWGIRDLDGHWVVAPKFQEVRILACDDRREMVGGRIQDEWQILRTDGEPIGSFDHIQTFSEGRAIVGRGKKFGSVDCDGNLVVPLRFEGLSYFIDGMAPFRENGKFGAIDPYGNVLIEPKFDKVFRFDGKSRAGATLNGKKVWIDRAGGVISGQDRDQCPDGRRVAERDGKKQIVDDAGKPIHETLFEYIHLVCDAPAVVSPSKGQWGFIDASGRLLAGRYFDNLIAFYNGLAVIYLGNETGIMNDAGEFKFGPAKLARVISHSGSGVIEIEQDEGYVVLDEALVARLARDPAALARPLPPKVRCGEGVVAMTRNGKWGFADEKGQFFIEPAYDEVGCFRNGLAWVAIPERREWCEIDKRGDLVPGRKCSCEQPIAALEHWYPPPSKDCYQTGLDVIRGMPRL